MPTIYFFSKKDGKKKNKKIEISKFVNGQLVAGIEKNVQFQCE